MNILYFLVANLSSAFLTVLGTFAIIGICLMVQSMVKTWKAKQKQPDERTELLRYLTTNPTQPFYNFIVGLGMLAMLLSTCIPLIMLVGTGALQAPIGFVVGVLIANKKKGWWINQMNKFTVKIEQATGN